VVATGQARSTRQVRAVSVWCSLRAAEDRDGCCPSAVHWDRRFRNEL